MRTDADSGAVRSFVRALGRAASGPSRVYLVGGATAVLEGWRDSTIDVDIVIEPEEDDLLRALPELKERLGINIELASPLDFIPEPPGWRDRSVFVADEGPLTIYHLDPYSQALAKIERDIAQDREDVANMITSGMVDPDKLLELFQAIEPQLYRFPAIDPVSFRRGVERALGRA